MECPMSLLQATLLLCLAVLSQCQVKFVEDTPKPPSASNRHDGPKIPETCKASNGQQGVCYEFRSTEFGECSFFPSTDTSDPAVEKHLSANTCINTGRQIYFCCPQKITLPTADECEVSLSDNVVGGELTVDGEFPWLAALGYLNSAGGFTQTCGGTLITKQHVLTASHCFNTRHDKEIVRLGEFNLNDDDDRAQDFKIADDRQMNFDNVSMENDIMILKLDKPVPTFTDNLRAACLPYHLRNYDFTGTNLTVAGWGVYQQVVYGNQVLGKQSPLPLKVTLPVVPLEDCQATYKRVSVKRIFKIDEKQLCAGKGGGTDACGGDSGGPMHYLDLNKGRNYVVGLVSFGPTLCGNYTIPGVYTRTGAFLDWIKETVELLQ